MRVLYFLYARVWSGKTVLSSFREQDVRKKLECEAIKLLDARVVVSRNVRIVPMAWQIVRSWVELVNMRVCGLMVLNSVVAGARHWVVVQTGIVVWREVATRHWMWTLEVRAKIVEGWHSARVIFSVSMSAEVGIVLGVHALHHQRLVDMVVEVEFGEACVMGFVGHVSRAVRRDVSATVLGT